MRKVISVGFILFVLCCSVKGYTQSKLEQSKKELNASNHKESNSNSKKNEHTHNSEANEIISNGFVNYFTTAAGITYYLMFGFYKDENHLHSPLTRYPYYNQLSGNYEQPDSLHNTKNRARLDIEGKYLYSGKDLYGNHVAASIRPFQFVYIKGNYYNLTEYDNSIKISSNLSFYNAQFCYDRLRFGKFNLGWNLGVNYIASGVERAGFSYGFNIDAFLFKHFSLNSAINWSRINGQAANTFDVTGKYHFNRFFIAAGYEHYKIGTPGYDFLSMGGGLYF